ncbi:hypothetical protein [Limosilactobacillus oris]|jgi:hypothetical protein|uniref:hypothetical protein n=1 Tax=Limosilactobacillus oris TaxID=1632 RepID=UPI0018843697|nr:hypothetical protein [Limosilactobacillus oris]MBF0601522.1 hypothetical protein [Limosilactobacillus oris]
MNKNRVRLRCTYHGCELKQTGGIPYLAPYFDPLLQLLNIEVLDSSNHWKLFSKHALVHYGKQFARLGKLKRNDVIELTAQLRKDGSFVYPAHVRLLTNGPRREKIPESRTELIGYVMTQNGLYHLGGKYEYPHYVNQYENWLNKKDSTADQSKAESSSITPNQSYCHHHYGTHGNEKKGEK